MPQLITQERIERQELHCHACDRYVQFSLDVSLNGNHVLHCPNCGHEHCRVVRDGKITDIRWSQRNGPTYQATSVTNSTTAIYTWPATSVNATTILYGSWINGYYS